MAFDGSLGTNINVGPEDFQMGVFFWRLLCGVCDGLRSPSVGLHLHVYLRNGAKLWFTMTGGSIQFVGEIWVEYLVALDSLR